MGEKGQDLLAVGQAIPSDRPVAESGDGEPAVGVHAPGPAGRSDPPGLLSRGIEKAQGKACAQQESRAVRFDRQAFGRIVLQGDGVPLQLGR